MYKKPSVFVGPHKGDNKVQVKVGGDSRARKLFDTKKEALPFAEKIATDLKTELVEQRLKDGVFISKDSFGNDPCPPKDKEH
jgi:hypothetical protein